VRYNGGYAKTGPAGPSGPSHDTVQLTEGLGLKIPKNKKSANHTLKGERRAHTNNVMSVSMEFSKETGTAVSNEPGGEAISLYERAT